MLFAEESWKLALLFELTFTLRSWKTSPRAGGSPFTQKPSYRPSLHAELKWVAGRPVSGPRGSGRAPGGRPGESASLLWLQGLKLLPLLFTLAPPRCNLQADPAPKDHLSSLPPHSCVLKNRSSEPKLCGLSVTGVAGEVGTMGWAADLSPLLAGTQTDERLAKARSPAARPTELCGAARSLSPAV